MGEEDIKESIWNIDDAQLRCLFEIKLSFIQHKLTWDLDNCYWDVRTLWMELDSNLDREEREEAEKELNKLTETRGKYNERENQETIKKSEYYSALEHFYMSLCRLMKHHGLYFREREDDEGL